jgi:TonB family protein
MEASMPAVSQKIRTGLVELRTHIGSAYVSPSFWERIYLLWTFRHFQSLPKQVLNRRQQQLIDRLCHTPIVSRNAPIARTSIIGTVENVRLIPDCKTEAAASTNKLVEIGTTSAAVATSQAVGSEGISIRSNRAAHNRIDVGRFPRQSGNVQYISATKQTFAEHGENKEANTSVDSDARRARSRNRAGWALAVACGVALLGILLYFREGQLALPMTVAQVGIGAHLPTSGSIPSAAAAQPEKVHQSMPEERRQPATIIGLKPPSPAVSSRQHESRNRETVILSQPPVATLDSTPRERLQIAEAPESGFSYPVAPSPTLTGKVSLEAVIDTNGTVTEVDVLSGNGILASAAVQAVRHWRYHPHELKGHAVEAETNIVISFVGADAVSIIFPAAH